MWGVGFRVEVPTISLRGSVRKRALRFEGWFFGCLDRVGAAPRTEGVRGLRCRARDVEYGKEPLGSLWFGVLGLGSSFYVEGFGI